MATSDRSPQAAAKRQSL